MQNIKVGTKIKILGYNCGDMCEHRFSCCGFIVGKVLTIEAVQPYGPVTVRTNGDTFTIGRNMFNRLVYEVCNEEDT